MSGDVCNTNSIVFFFFFFFLKKKVKKNSSAISILEKTKCKIQYTICVAFTICSHFIGISSVPGKCYPAFFGAQSSTRCKKNSKSSVFAFFRPKIFRKKISSFFF